MSHADVIEAITERLRIEERVRALFLSGSHACGLDDAYSDIDFLLVSPEGAVDEIAALWRGALETTGPLVLWRDRQVNPSLINAITKDWLRIDLMILKPEQLGRQTKKGLKCLFDRDGLHGSLRDEEERSSPDPARLRYQFEEFIRVLGLLAVAAGREEYINGVTGIFHLRNLLVELLIEETGVPNRGGALHLNRLITDEQKELLAALPPPEPTRSAMISVHLAYAEAYLPRARRLAKVWGVDWPDRFEQATWDHLRASLSLDPPYALARDEA
jgi:predicted nucleotidyltransferase